MIIATSVFSVAAITQEAVEVSDLVRIAQEHSIEVDGL